MITKIRHYCHAQHLLKQYKMKAIIPKTKPIPQIINVPINVPASIVCFAYFITKILIHIIQRHAAIIINRQLQYVQYLAADVTGCI